MATTEVLGTCHHDCPDSCGWVVTVTDGVATKLRGDPEHPYSRGELCPKVNRFLDRVYSPDRVLHPMVRVGPKGEGRFEQVSWDDALALIAARTGAAIDRHGPETVLPWYDAGNQSALSIGSLGERFFSRMAASRVTGSLCGAVAKAGVASTLGTGQGMDPMAVRHSQLIILWGTNTRLTNRHLWPFIEEARSQGATVVVIDPIRTATAEAADWFVQPLPGTDVALMLAMIHVLIRDDLIDTDYVERYTVGFDELAERVADWTPERAAATCGLPVADVERLARMYGTVRPVAIRTLIGAEHREHGAMLFRTMACLPALVGAWRDRGGGLARSVGSWTEVMLDGAGLAGPSLSQGRARRGISMNHLGRALTDDEMSPPLTALFVWNGNPLVTVPNAELTRVGLEREDLFTVVHEQFVTDTARFADVVLPATTQIEQLDVVPSWGSLHIGINHQAIEPLGEAVSNTELFRRLAGAMGFTDPELFEDDETLLATAVAPLGDEAIDALHRDGHIRIDVDEDLRPFAEGGFPTPSGKTELYSEKLTRQGHDIMQNDTDPREGPGGYPELTSRFPLVLLTPKVHTRFLNSSYSQLPKHGPLEGRPYVELCAHDAATRGLGDGDEVRVWNDRGELRLAVKITERLRPGVAAVPFGWWREHHEGARGTANSLTNDTLSDWGGGVAYHDTLVEVARV